MNRIINMYYKEFESYGNFWSLKNPKLFFSIASLFLFIYFVFNLFDSDKRNYLFQDSGLYFVLMAEVFALLLFRSLEKQRDDYIIEKYGKKYNKALGLSEIKKK